MKPHPAFELFFEIIGWVKIALSPILISTFVGGLIYFLKPNDATMVIAIVILLAGFITGIYFANKAWKKDGTMHFLSRTMATPELDEKKQNDD